jgi:hypothetical protein
VGYKQTELRSRKRKYERAAAGATGPTAAKARRGTVVEEKSTSVDGSAAVIRIDTDGFVDSVSRSGSQQSDSDNLNPNAH